MINLDSLVKEYLDTKFNPSMTKLQNYESKIKTIVIPRDLDKFRGFYQNIETLRNTINMIDVNLNAQDLNGLIETKFEKELSDFQDKEHAIHQKYESMIDAKKHDLQEEAELHNNSVTKEWAENNQQYIKLEEKRKALLKYSDNVQEICDMYGIVSSDCQLSEKDFTVDALSKEYDKYIRFLNTKSKSINPITVLKEKVPNVEIQTAIIAVCLIACFTPILDIVAILFFSVTLIKQSGLNRVVENYARIYALMHNIQPLNMGYTESVEETKLESTDISDEDERLDDLVDEWTKELEGLDESNPEEELNKAKATLASNFMKIQREFGECISKHEQLKTDILNKINKLEEIARNNEKELRDKVKFLCERYHKGYVLDTRFALGLIDNNIEEFIDVGHKNIVIRPGNDKTKYAQFIQVMLANAFLNVKGNSLDVTVVDPVYRCKDFMAFYKQGLTDVNLHLNERELKPALDDAMKFMDKNMKEMRGRPIYDYNKLCEETNAAPREYRLLIVASDGDDLITKEEWQGVLKTSAVYGVIIWIISNADVSAIKDDVYVFDSPFSGVSCPYNINLYEFPNKFMKCYDMLVKDSKLPPLTFSAFIKNTIPDDRKWWNRQRLAKTDKHYKEFDNDFIHICPGYYEGDPAKADDYTFGHQGNVHIIGVGGTGAGKSVFLNFVIMQLCMVYAPDELELWLVDYKGAEFTKYIASQLNDFKSLPHVKACLCTSDGDYAGSLYHAYRADAEKRYDMFTEVGCSSLKEYNAKMTAQGHPEKRLPRLVMINDEFQVIFEKADPKILEQIKADMTYLAKIGRASGHHLFFTSQSMNKTLSPDVLQQFNLRFVLRCALDVSNDILGNKAAGLIKENNGFLYVRSYDNDWANNPPRYRTPFINDGRPKDKNGNETGEMSEVEKTICIIYDEAQKIGFKQSRVLTYNEKDKHKIEEIEEFYKKYKSKPDELSDLFLLGERMTYSDSLAPQHIKLTAKNNKHIFSVFANYEDLVDFYKTMIYNIRLAVNSCDYIINSQVKDLHYICEVDKDSDPDLLSMSNEKTSVKEFISFIQQVYDARIESGKRDTPFYVICIGWDKAEGFGVNRNVNVTNQTQNLMQLCAEYNIHFIFICSSLGQIPTNLLNACQYRICGKSSENDSLDVIGSKQAYKSEMKSGFMYLLDSGEVTRAKLYQYPKTRAIKSDKLSF